MSSLLPDILAVLGLALLGYGLFLLFGLGWCCLGSGSIMLIGGAYLATPASGQKADKESA